MNDKEVLKQIAQRFLQNAQRDAAAFLQRTDLLIAVGALIAAVVVLYLLFDTLAYAAIPTLDVPLKQEELAEELDAPQYSPPKTLPKDKIPCYDPGTMQLLGHAKAMTPAEVRCLFCGRARCVLRAAFAFLKAAPCEVESSSLIQPRAPCSATAITHR